MAETNNLNTRIQLKYDSYTNWTDTTLGEGKGANLILKAGEIGLCAIPTGATAVNGDNIRPQVLFKVGDGVSTFAALPWASAKAADVYEWAKAEKKPVYAATEITGIGDYIAEYVDETLGISVDTDTQYRILKVDDYNYKLQSKAKGEADTAFADVSTIVIPKYDDTDVKADIEALETLVGTTAVATQITNAITALDLANTYETKGAAAQALEDAKQYADDNDTNTAHTHVKGTGIKLETAVNGGIEGEVQLGLNVAFELVDKEIKLYDKDDATKTAIATLDATNFIKDGMLASVEADVNANTLTFTWNTDSGVEVTEIPLNSIADIYTAQNTNEIAMSISNENKISADLVVDSIVESKLHPNVRTKLNKEWQPVGNYKITQEAYSAEGSATKTITKVEQNANGEVNVTYGDIIYPELEVELIKTNTSEADKIAVYQLLKVAEDNAHKIDMEAVEVATPKGVENAAAALVGTTEDTKTANTIYGAKAYADDAVNTATNTLQGEIDKKANDADLAAIAKSGNVNDLIQTEGDVLILNCGTASTVL